MTDYTTQPIYRVKERKNHMPINTQYDYEAELDFELEKHQMVLRYKDLIGTHKRNIRRILKQNSPLMTVKNMPIRQLEKTLRITNPIIFIAAPQTGWATGFNGWEILKLSRIILYANTPFRENRVETLKWYLKAHEWITIKDEHSSEAIKKAEAEKTIRDEEAHKIWEAEWEQTQVEQAIAAKEKEAEENAPKNWANDN